MSLPFHGISTFLKSPISAARRFGFVGLPYDAATSFRPGARFAPAAIREASKFLTDGAHPTLGVDPCGIVSDLGDIPIAAIEPEAAQATIRAYIMRSRFKGQMIFAGGDHSCTLGIVAALATRLGRKLAVVHFDAHCDTWIDHFGHGVGHGTWVRNAVEQQFVDPEAFVSIGLRSPVQPEIAQWLGEQGGLSLSARHAMRLPPEVMISMIAERVRDRPTYISFDIDAFDPAYAPGTGTPEVAGLTPWWVLDVIEGLGGLDLVGLDVVEVCPPFDHACQTSLLAATLLWTYVAVAGAHPGAARVA